MAGIEPGTIHIPTATSTTSTTTESTAATASGEDVKGKRPKLPSFLLPSLPSFLPPPPSLPLSSPPLPSLPFFFPALLSLRLPHFPPPAFSPTLSLSSGDVVTQECVDRLILKNNMLCPITGKTLKEKDLIILQRVRP